jgi:hypothetical protein
LKILNFVMFIIEILLKTIRSNNEKKSNQ